jgi:hypothetical protein
LHLFRAKIDQCQVQLIARGNEVITVSKNNDIQLCQQGTTYIAGRALNKNPRAFASDISYAIARILNTCDFRGGE